MINSGWWNVSDCNFVRFYIFPFFFWCQVQTLCWCHCLAIEAVGTWLFLHLLRKEIKNNNFRLTISCKNSALLPCTFTQLTLMTTSYITIVPCHFIPWNVMKGLYMVYNSIEYSTLYLTRASSFKVIGGQHFSHYSSEVLLSTAGDGEEEGAIPRPVKLRKWVKPVSLLQNLTESPFYQCVLWNSKRKIYEAFSMFTHLSPLLVAKRTGILRYHFWYKLLCIK